LVKNKPVWVKTGTGLLGLPENADIKIKHIVLQIKIFGAFFNICRNGGGYSAGWLVPGA
jgi:hypothetical protein